MPVSMAQVKAELVAWERETGHTLPRDALEIAWLERSGAVVDLVTGEVFRPGDQWGDFARRWAAEQVRAESEVSAARLAAVVRKASGNGYGEKLCAAIAAQTLAAVARDLCAPAPSQGSATVQVGDGRVAISASGRTESRC